MQQISRTLYIDAIKLGLGCPTYAARTMYDRIGTTYKTTQASLVGKIAVYDFSLSERLQASLMLATQQYSNSIAGC